jgi:3-isopropylmalate/(R)-2-methylmalate dehydratase small subunit
VDELFRRTERAHGYQITIDLENQIITDGSDLRLRFQIDPFRRECLLKGLDDIGLTLRMEDAITAYEKAHRPQAIMYEPIDAAASGRP